MKLASTGKEKQDAMPGQMKSDPAAGKSMAPPPFDLGAGPTQMKKLEDEENDKLASASQLKAEDEKEEKL